MKNNQASKAKESITNLKYEVNDKPGILTSVLLGFQNILTAFSGIIAVPLIIAGIAGCDVSDTAYLVSAALLASGISSIIQSRGFGPKKFRTGVGLPTVMGTDFGFVPPANTVINTMGGGLAGYFGASILGAVFEFILSFFVKPLMKIFTPVVTGTVITLMGMSMMPVAFDWVGGGVGNPNYGDIVIGFSTANRINHYETHSTIPIRMFNENKMDSAFRATAEAVEEAILNSLVCAETTTGKDGNRRVSLKEYLR